MSDKLEKILDELPKTPGVYLMKTARGKIIYIGKAKNLRSRVRSYFSGSKSDTRFFARNVRRLVGDIEILLTSSEKEALLLENNLIKTHTPRFNIRLRDDKEYLCLRLDPSAAWPKLEIVRRPKKDGASYFGPYHSASMARETFKLVQRHFKLRACTDRQFASRIRPCLQHQMHRCFGPCVLSVDQTEYRQQIEYVRLFLLGRREDLIQQLQQSMATAAQQLEYEKAALYRDQIKAVQATLSPQSVATPGGIDQDVVGICRQGDQVQIVVLEVRKGRLNGRVDFDFSGIELPDTQILSSFIMQRYQGGERLPREILVSRPLDEAAALCEILSEQQGKNVAVIHPQRGSKTEQTAMADLNAKQLLESRLREADSIRDRLSAIQRRLKLPRLPSRIECVDISHLGGANTVGAISVLIDGRAMRSLGRTYRVNTATEGDDFAAMTEVLTRRFIRSRDAEEGWEAPDLLVVDGGRGQLAVALAVLEQLSITDQPVVALAKEHAGQEGAETDRVFLPGRKNPIPLKARTSSLHLLALSRDEAHRLANKYRKTVTRKKTTQSVLDSIPGVGPKLKAALLKQIGSIKRIRSATEDELVQVPGVGPALARQIKQLLGT